MLIGQRKSNENDDMEVNSLLSRDDCDNGARFDIVDGISNNFENKKNSTEWWKNVFKNGRSIFRSIQKSILPSMLLTSNRNGSS